MYQSAWRPRTRALWVEAEPSDLLYNPRVARRRQRSPTLGARAEFPERATAFLRSFVQAVGPAAGVQVVPYGAPAAAIPAQTGLPAPPAVPMRVAPAGTPRWVWPALAVAGVAGVGGLLFAMSR